MPSPELAAYEDSLIWQMREASLASGQPFTAIFTDLDETLHHQERREATKRLYEISTERKWPIIVLTGNGAASIFERTQNGQFPAPHVIVGNVSTDIWVLRSQEGGKNNYVQDTFFAESLRKKYPRREIVQSSLELRDRLATKVPQAKFDFQHPEREKEFIEKNTDSSEPYKVSFYFQASTLENVEHMRQLVTQHFPTYRALISHHSRHNRQFPEDTPMYCLDILPMTKGDTVEYVRKLLGIGQGIVAGDSGNDVEMLIETSQELRAIMVGGSKPEAVSALEKATTRHTRIPGVRFIRALSSQEKLCYREVHSEHIGPDSIVEGIDILLELDPQEL